ncbi:MAG: hypothetical protein EBZ77_06215 [Chitinophagia bacterium]|nr:hypothetical protein [Chitinophagia bacterium]
MKIRLVLKWVLTLLGCIMLPLMSVGSEKDSLLRVVQQHKTADTAKVHLYARLSFAYRYTSMDSLMLYAKTGLRLAEALHDNGGRAACMVPLAVSFLISNELDSGLYYCNSALAIYTQLGDSAAKAGPLFYRATIYYNQSRYNEAIADYLYAARLFHVQGNQLLEANAYTNAGNAYGALGNPPDALKYFLQGLRVREAVHDTEEIVVSLSNIGQVYADMDNFQQADVYVTRSLAWLNKLSDPSGKMITYENAGGVYLAMSDNKRAIAAFIQAMKIADSAGLRVNRKETLVNLGEAYVEAGNIEEARKTFTAFLSDTVPTENPAIDAMLHRGLGRIAKHDGNHKKAIEELQLSLELSRVNELTRFYMEDALDLSETYEAIGDYKKALAMRDTFYRYKDRITSEKNSMKMQQLQFDYELQKKQRQIEHLNQHKLVTQVRTAALVVGLAFLGILSAVLYRGQRGERRRKETIAEQVAKLAELNKYKDMIFSVMSHDLRGPLASLSVIMGMLNNNDITVEEFNELKKDIDKQLGSVTFLLDNLLRWSKNYMVSGKATKPEAVALKPIADQNLQLIAGEADRKGISLIDEISPAAIALADGSQVDIILRNLLSNALKFTPTGGSITVTAVKDAGKIKLSVRDTGVGMTREQLDRLFQAAPNKSTYGTSGEKGIGLGLLLCYEFVQANGGTIAVESEPEKGTLFKVELPAA